MKSPEKAAFWPDHQQGRWRCKGEEQTTIRDVPGPLLSGKKEQIGKQKHVKVEVPKINCYIFYKQVNFDKQLR